MSLPCQTCQQPVIFYRILPDVFLTSLYLELKMVKARFFLLVCVSMLWGLHSASGQDTTAPVITLNPAAIGPITMRCNNPPYVDPGYKAYDNYDGDITSRVRTFGKVHTNRKGTYQITYVVSDMAGNSDTAYRTVEVAEEKLTDKIVVHHSGSEFLFTTDQMSSVRHLHQWILDGDTLSASTNEVAVEWKSKDHLRHEICLTETYCGYDTSITYCKLFSDTLSDSKWVYFSSFRDLDGNCTKDSKDEKNLWSLGLSLRDPANRFVPVIHSLEGYSAYALIDSNVQYRIDLPVLPDDTISLACLNHPLVIAPQNYKDTVKRLTIAVSCKKGLSDYACISNLRGHVFPGKITELLSWIGNRNYYSQSNCGAPDSGRLILSITGPARFVTYKPQGPSLDSMGEKKVILKYSNLSLSGRLQPVSVAVAIDTNAQMFDTVSISALLETAAPESDKLNNLYTEKTFVSNSHDPNMIQVDRPVVEPGFKDALTYTIYFQNTGNAAAIDIQILDTLSHWLDTGSLELLSSSHPVNVFKDKQTLRFLFKDINLPDSGSDEAGSNGYLQYKVKPLTGMADQTFISNKAYIYFDYNSPILTNTVVTEVRENQSELRAIQTSGAWVYPNPLTEFFCIENPFPSGCVFQIIGSQGQIQMSGHLAHGLNPFSSDQLPAGIYWLLIQSPQGVWVEKVLKF